MARSQTIRPALACGLLVPCLLATSLAGWGPRWNIGWGPGYHAGDYRGVRSGSAWTDYRPPGAPPRAPQCDCPRCRSAEGISPEPTLAPSMPDPTAEAAPAEELPAVRPLPAEPSGELPPAERWPEELPPREERPASPASEEAVPASPDSRDEILELFDSLFPAR